MNNRAELIAQLLAFINRADTTPEDLDVVFEFPGGIGSEIGSNIIAARNRLLETRGDGFRSLDELDKVRLIGKRRLDGMLAAVKKGALSKFLSSRAGEKKIGVRLPIQSKPVPRKNTFYPVSKRVRFPIGNPCLNGCLKKYSECLRQYGSDRYCLPERIACEWRCVFSI
jgi:hypothetical protein